MCRGLLATVVLVVAPHITGAQSESPRVASDSSSVAPTASAPWVTRNDLLWLGGATLATVAIAPLDHPIAREFDEPHWKNSRDLRHLAGDVAFFGSDGPFLASAIVATASAVTGATGLRRFAVHNMEAIALATIITGVGKGISGRALPGVAAKHAFSLGRGFHDSNGPFVSFPSGHTAAAFAMAATIAGEVQRTGSSRAKLVRWVSFGAATAVGVARVAQRMHWPSDLPLAAAIGTWSGDAVDVHADDNSGFGALLRGFSVAPAAGGRVFIGWTAHASAAR